MPCHAIHEKVSNTNKCKILQKYLPPPVKKVNFANKVIHKHNFGLKPTGMFTGNNYTE